MPFIPHTSADVAQMLDVIGAGSIDALFDEIPSELRCAGLQSVPAGLTEMEVSALMAERAATDGRLINFIGAGAYEHHIPAAVWEITTRGEFYSAYTPYQAEASQGTLQLLYEYQSMMTALTGMEVSNASLYDGASALAEAVLMAERCHSAAQRRVLVPATLNPTWLSVLRALVSAQDIEVQEISYCPDADGGRIGPKWLAEQDLPPFTSLVIPQPNFFGIYEDVDALTDWAQAQGALVIAVVNPVSLALLKPPGQWGERGADLVCGEGQPLGAPISSGGPYFGFLTARQAYVRQMPGRIVGRTVDLEGNNGYVLTLQAREQHIRRAKATSNICTNQGLLVTAATIHLSLLGADGLARVATACVANTAALVDRLTRIPGVQRVFDQPVFHECVLRLQRPVAPVLEGLAEAGIAGGLDLSRLMPELGHSLLVCATETRTPAQIERYGCVLESLLQS